MAWAFNNSADGGNNGGTTSSLTFSYTVGSGSLRLLVVALLGDTTVDDVTGVTYNGVAMTLAAKLTSVDASNRVSYLYYLLNPASGANNVVISAASSHYLLAGAADYTGILQSGQPDATITHLGANSSLNTLTTSVTTVANNALVVLMENGYSGGITFPPTAGTGATLRTVGSGFANWALFDSGSPVTPAGSYGMTTNRPGSGSDSIGHVLVSFAPDTGGTTVALTGVSDTVGAGTLAPSIAMPVTGVQDATAAQAFVPPLTLQGVLSTTALGAWAISGPIITVIPPGPFPAVSDYKLIATSAAAFQTAAAALGHYANGNYVYAGRTLDGGSYRLMLQGMITPSLAQVSIQPFNPAIFTDNVGLPSQPEVALVNNPKVNMLSRVPGTPQFQAILHWYSGSPLPNYPYYGVAMTPLTRDL